MSGHVFVDNSNIFGGAQRATATLEPSASWRSIRIYYRNFFQLLEGNGSVATRVLAGSVPPDNDALWQYAKAEGYATDLLRRVERDDGRLGEQSVDETLHLKIANSLLDHVTPQTLVIASGDGSETETGTSFPGQAERALRCGWLVEVWSWRDQLSSRYIGLAHNHPGRVSVQTLDPFYRSITFVKGGEYEVDGATVALPDRIVSPLPTGTVA